MEIVADQRKAQTRFLSKVYGYVAVGLLLTAIIAFVVGAMFAKAFHDQDSEIVLSKYFYLMVVAGIALLIDTIVMRIILNRGRRSGWIPYLIYCSLFGIFLSTFVTVGIPFQLFGEAFAISGLIFFILFLVGYFSPINMNIIGSIATALLLGVLLIGCLFLLFTFINPELYTIYDVLTSGGILIYMTIMIAVDAYNIKRYASFGGEDTNLILHCAVSLYTDFLYVFVRVLYYVARAYSKLK